MTECNNFEQVDSKVFASHLISTFYILEDGVSVSGLNESLTEWVNSERFATFIKVTRGNIHQVH